jgi:hypothetical protein
VHSNSYEPAIAMPNAFPVHIKAPHVLPNCFALGSYFCVLRWHMTCDSVIDQAKVECKCSGVPGEVHRACARFGHPGLATLCC